MSRPRFALILALVASLCLALAAGAAAKPHAGQGHKKKATPLVVDAPSAAQLPVGVPTKVTVKVANHGKAPIAGVVLLAKGSKEVKVAPAKAKVGTLKPHKSKAETFTVTVTAAGKRTLEFVAKAPHQAKAHDGVALKVAAPKEEPKKEEPKKTPDIVGRYFWNSELVVGTTYFHGYYFVDEHWVYRGIPEGGLPSCSSQTANGEEDGCLPYTWDESTGSLNIAGAGGEYKVGTHVLKVGDDNFSEAVPAEAGSRFDASGSYINGFGICPINCTFTTIELEMSSNGEFARAVGVVGFFGEGGSYGALPPESHGTYNVDQRGRVVFSYADGHTVTETIAVMLDDNDNPDPDYGLMLDSRDFFGPHSGV